tara:strand:- start:396 stop:617 length:222 start_codon:yes stop_codon:yes gene_type:complete
MINYNLILYIGIAFFMVGFLLFLFCQYKIRDCEIAEFKNEQLSKSFNKQKEKDVQLLNTIRAQRKSHIARGKK